MPTHSAKTLQEIRTLAEFSLPHPGVQALLEDLCLALGRGKAAAA